MRQEVPLSEIHAAAHGDIGWEAALQAIARSCRSRGAALFSYDRTKSRSILHQVVGIEDAFCASYVKHFAPINPWLKRGCHLVAGAVLSSQATLPHRELQKTEFYADWLRPQGLAYGLGANLIQRANCMTKITLLREEGDADFSDAEIDGFRHYVPPLQQALEHAVHKERESLIGQAATAVLSQLDVPIILLAADGTVVHRNASATDLLANRDGLAVDSVGCLVCIDAESNFQLSVLRDRRTGSMEARRAAHLPPHELQLSSVAVSEAGSTWFKRPVIAVYVNSNDRLPNTAFRADRLARLLSLTPSEARIASAVAQGHSIRGAADALGIAESTARTLLKRVMSKTGTRRQAELVLFIVTRCGGGVSLRTPSDQRG